VANAIRGRRGQAFLRELRDALDALPDKRLVADQFVAPYDEEGGGACVPCALGAVALARGFDHEAIERLECDAESQDHDSIACTFGISQTLVREIEDENDEGVNPRWAYDEKLQRWGKPPDGYDVDAARWRWMRRWAEERIEEKASRALGGEEDAG